MRIENEEHGKDGTRFHECSNYEGMVSVCLCGERFVDESDLEEHIEEHSTHGTLRTNRQSH